MKKKLKSTCDDSHFMCAEILLDLNTADNLGGIRMNFDLQAGFPLYLRKLEIADLIKNLQELHDLIPNKQ